MKKIIPAYLKRFRILILLLLCSTSSFASHIVGVDLFYTWLSGNTYQITLKVYGNCGAASSACFATLPTAVPQICIYNGDTYVTSIDLTIQAPSAGVEITPVCPLYRDSTQCSDPSSSIPGIVKFIYTGTYTFPTTSNVWRILFGGYMGASCGLGRAAAVTNIAGGSDVQVIDTLNNTVYNPSSPVLSVDPVPFFCLDNLDCYNPGASDAAGDSLVFALVPGQDGTAGATCSIGGLVTYTGTTTATNPLEDSAGTFEFNTSNGQICFKPNALQRALVCYNIESWLHDTLLGTCQREMTFLVQTCTYSAPTAGIDSITGGGVLVNPTTFRACSNSGPFSLILNPVESGITTDSIYVTYSSLPPGATITITNDGTSHPNIVITGTTASTVIPPGTYTFGLDLFDNNCPIPANEDLAYTVIILPQPTLAYSVIATPSCLTNEIVEIIPGGNGNPWTVTLSNGLDTIQKITGVNTTFLDTIPSSTVVMNDTITIMTIDSTYCDVYLPITITPPPPFVPTVTTTNPPYCGSDSGYIVITNLVPNGFDTVTYQFDGTTQPPIAVTADSSGQIVITGLLAGTYSDVLVYYGNCISDTMGPYSLFNPAMEVGILTRTNPTRCGYCDGVIVLHGLHPSQTDTLNYELNGVPQPTVISFVSGDSTITLTNLCPGTYSTFSVTTDGVCSGANLGPISLDTPALLPRFTYSVAYGCHGDTVWFNDFSIDTGLNFSSDSGLFYEWNFGDGTTDTARSPMHIYATGGTYHVELTINNLKCLDSTSQNITLFASLNAAIAPAPNPVCQGTMVNMNNTSVATDPTYLWSFGDGDTDYTANPTHTYNNTGSYVITLIVTDFVPCHDTVSVVMQVDSISGITMSVSDTTLCLGSQVSFAATYSSIGNTGLTWTFGDGSVISNQNPVHHSYDATGTMYVTAEAFYRVCPDTSVTLDLRVYKYPSVYLGTDSTYTICAGGDPVFINDNVNAGNPAATWQWNTGETTPGIYVTKPASYILTVTIDGCQTIDTIQVNNGCYIAIPNVFTPNGDGVNDYFFPRQLLSKGLASFKMEIYNRWGQLLFETNNIDGRGWDGAFNNVQQPEGVYVYIIDATFVDGETEHHQGNVTIIR